MNKEEKISRGHQAERLLNDEILVEAFNALEMLYVSQWRRSETPEGRENVFHCLRALDRLRAHLRSQVTTGNVTKKEVNELNFRRSWRVFENGS